MGFKKSSHVVLTTHASQMYQDSIPIKWGAANPEERGPVVASLTDLKKRNVIGTHSGSYTVYRALSIAAGKFPLTFKPDLSLTDSTTKIVPQDSWFDPDKIVSIDPWGADVNTNFNAFFKKGYDIRPTIAVTQARLQIGEVHDAVKKGRLQIDGKIITDSGDIRVTKVALESVWHLPGIAKRLAIEEGDLRKILFQETGGMFPELVTRPDIKVLLPPIGSTTLYIFGNPKDLANPDIELTCRVHDECNGSDVFGSDICTCRPYLMYGIEDAARTAQRGGVGIIAYYRKEGRALGEVTKFLVYNARKRQTGGDTPANYFHRTECVAGVEDARFQELMPDPLQWLGIKVIHNMHSMSNMKFDAIIKSGIKIINRIAIPEDLIPIDAQVEIEAKIAAGYFTTETVKREEVVKKVVGRKIEE
jgi:GTP cyclohydrolase II